MKQKSSSSFYDKVGLPGKCSHKANSEREKVNWIKSRDAKKIRLCVCSQFSASKNNPSHVCFFFNRMFSVSSHVMLRMWKAAPSHLSDELPPNTPVAPLKYTKVVVVAR